MSLRPSVAHWCSTAALRSRQIQSLSRRHWSASCDHFSPFVQLCWTFTALRWRSRLKIWSLHVCDSSVMAGCSPLRQQGCLLFLGVFSLHKYCKCLAGVGGSTASGLCVSLQHGLLESVCVCPCFGLCVHMHTYTAFMLTALCYYYEVLRIIKALYCHASLRRLVSLDAGSSRISIKLLQCVNATLCGVSQRFAISELMCINPVEVVQAPLSINSNYWTPLLFVISVITIFALIVQLWSFVPLDRLW